jgi:hypothetical protein
LFQQEAKRLTNSANIPQIPRLIAYFEQDKLLYLGVQELIEANLLAELPSVGFL